LSQECTSAQIGFYLSTVLTTINLDHNFPIEAAKVHNVAADRLLAAELGVIDLPRTET